jgi:hypothetical protein
MNPIVCPMITPLRSMCADATAWPPGREIHERTRHPATRYPSSLAVLLQFLAAGGFAMKRLLSAVFAVALGLALSTAVASAETAGQKVDRGIDKTKDTAQDTKDSLKSGGETMKEKTKDAAETVKDKTKSAATKIKDKTRAMKDRMFGHHGTTTMTTSDVMAMQQALKDKGHDPGAIDGKMGPHTRAALKDYQQSEGLKVTGRLDSETRTRLGMAAASETNPSASPSTMPATRNDTNATTSTTTNPAPGNPPAPSSKRQEP